MLLLIKDVEDTVKFLLTYNIIYAGLSGRAV